MDFTKNLDFIKKYSPYLKNEMEIYSYFKSGISEVVPYGPHMLYIEPTNACPLNCVFCARWKMTRPIKFMILDEFKLIIDKLLAEKIRYPYITITGNGEPLLNRDIFSMIKYAKSKDFNVSIITNAVPLTQESGEKLVKTGLDRCQFSFDSIDKATYEKIRRNANFEQTLSNILYFLKANEEKGHPVFISLSSVQCSYNKEQKKKYLSFWKSLPVDNIYTSWLYTLQADSGLCEEAKLVRSGKEYKICSLPWRQLSITPDGSILGCPQDFNNKYVLGNIFSDSLLEIWNGGKIKKLRRALMENKLDYFTKIHHDCSKCNAPYTDKWNSIKDCFDDIPIFAARTALTYLEQEKVNGKVFLEENNLKYKNLIRKIKLLENGNKY